MLILVSIGFFASAAVFGLFMATRILTGHKPPLPVALIHGGAGATGLGVLTWAVLSTGSFGSPALALAVLACNAILGFYLFSRHLREKPWPKFAVVTHGFAASIGFTLIVVFAMTRSNERSDDHKRFIAELKAGPLPVESRLPKPLVAAENTPPTTQPDEPVVDAGIVATVEAPQQQAEAFAFPAIFGHNQTTPTSVDGIAEVKTWLRQCTGMVTAVGHTTPDGPAASNYDIGLRRASSVRQYLFDHAITKRRIRLRSTGGEKEGNPQTRSVTLTCDSE